MIAAIAILSRDNSPVYMGTFTNDQSLKFHFVVQAALDVVEERGIFIVKKRAKGERADKYLGLLYPIEEFRVFGYLTNTDVKLIVITNELSSVREGEIRQFFTKLHLIYVNVMANPFYGMDTARDKQSFEKHVTDLVEENANKV